MADYVVDSARVLRGMHSKAPQMTTLSIGACTSSPVASPTP